MGSGDENGHFFLFLRFFAPAALVALDKMIAASGDENLLKSDP